MGNAVESTDPKAGHGKAENRFNSLAHLECRLIRERHCQNR